MDCAVWPWNSDTRDELVSESVVGSRADTEGKRGREREQDGAECVPNGTAQMQHTGQSSARCGRACSTWPLYGCAVAGALVVAQTEAHTRALPPPGVVGVR